MLYERNTGLHQQNFLSTLLTVTQYTLTDTYKKQRSFRIGVTSIFLVVTFVTFLKSIIDVAPVALLKASVDTSGAFDF